MTKAEAGQIGAAKRWQGHVRTPLTVRRQQQCPDTEARRAYYKTYYEKNKVELIRKKRERRARTGERGKKNALGERYESDRESHRRWRLRNPEKNRAHAAVIRAVKAGKLVKAPCAECGETEMIHGHHHNGYENPLDIVWLCPRHHREAHGQE